MTEGAIAAGAYPPAPSGAPVSTDIQKGAVRRLTVLSLVVAGIWTTIRLTNASLETSTGPGDIMRSQWLFYGTICVCALMLALTRVKSVRPALVIHVGLVFATLISIFTATAEAGSPWLANTQGGPTYLMCWILTFAALIPAQTKKMVIAIVISAAAGPITAGLAHNVHAMGRNAVLDGATVIVAIIISRMVSNLCAKVAGARDLGSYHLVKKIGAGGMGEVWKAQHVHLARPAAIKLIRPDTLGETAEDARLVLARFEREAQETALLRSPHTVQVYDYGVTGEGTVFYVMELLRGWDLESLVDKWGPLAPERAVPILAGVCNSLNEAHLRGLVHRDIKPGNILVCRYGTQYDFAKVLDFGLVKTPKVSVDVTLTQDGMTTGTPAFMAPEVALGKTEIRPAADIYALGCVAYFMLSGNRVFTGPTETNIMLAHVDDTPTPLGEAAEQDIPPELETLIMECLRKDPTQRPRNARFLRDSLLAVPLAQEWTQDDALAWWNAHWKADGEASTRSADPLGATVVARPTPSP